MNLFDYLSRTFLWEIIRNEGLMLALKIISADA